MYLRLRLRRVQQGADGVHFDIPAVLQIFRGDGYRHVGQYAAIGLCAGWKLSDQRQVHFDLRVGQVQKKNALPLVPRRLPPVGWPTKVANPLRCTRCANAKVAELFSGPISTNTLPSKGVTCGVVRSCASASDAGLSV